MTLAELEKECPPNISVTTAAKNKTSRFVSKQNHLLDQTGNQLKYSFRNQMIKRESQLKQLQNMAKLFSLETIRSEKKNLNTIQEKLRLVDPQNILKRGYSMTLLNGKIVKSVEQLNEGDRLETKLSDGMVESIVENKNFTNH